MNFSSGSQGSRQNLPPPVGTIGQAVSSPTICTNNSGVGGAVTPILAQQCFWEGSEMSWGGTGQQFVELCFKVEELLKNGPMPPFQHQRRREGVPGPPGGQEAAREKGVIFLVWLAGK